MNATSLAFGDIDGDRDQDLAIGAPGVVRIYVNQSSGGAISFVSSSSVNFVGGAVSLAWAMWIKTATWTWGWEYTARTAWFTAAIPGVLESSPAWTAPVSDNTRSIAWGRCG